MSFICFKSFFEQGSHLGSIFICGLKLGVRSLKNGDVLKKNCKRGLNLFDKSKVQACQLLNLN